MAAIKQAVISFDTPYEMSATACTDWATDKAIQRLNFSRKEERIYKNKR